MPSVTVVLRTQTDAGSGPQWTYLPPRLAVDPHWNDTLTQRRKQLLDVLERTGDVGYVELVCAMVEKLDFERGFFVLQNGVRALRDRGAWGVALGLFEQRHGSLAEGIGETIREIERRDALVALRSEVEDSEHRFFLALLLNIGSREQILRMIQERFECAPEQRVLQWVEELAVESEHEVRILDAAYPEDLETPVPKQLGFFLETLASCIRHERDLRKIRGKRREPGMTPELRQRLHAVLAASCLRALVV
jgi:hypothetical protein